MFKAFNARYAKLLGINLLISIGVGALSAYLTGNPEAAYDALIKPDFAPPGWVFPVVWSILYVLLGVSAFLASRCGTKLPGVREGLFYYGLLLLLTFFWPLIFFKWGLYGFSVVWIFALWVVAILTTIQFWQLRRSAGILVGIFTVWVTFAAVLNTAVWLLNRVI